MMVAPAFVAQRAPLASSVLLLLLLLLAATMMVVLSVFLASPVLGAVSAGDGAAGMLRYVLFVKQRPSAAAALSRSAVEGSRSGRFLTHAKVLALQTPDPAVSARVQTHLDRVVALWNQSSPTSQSSSVVVGWRPLTPAGDKLELVVPAVAAGLVVPVAGAAAAVAAPAAVAAGAGASSVRVGSWAALFPAHVEADLDFVAGGAAGREVGAPAARAALVASASRRHQRRSVRQEQQLQVSERQRVLGGRHRTLNDNPQACLAQSVTPPCLRKAYGLNATGPAPAKGNSQLVAVNEYFNPSDIEGFQKLYHLPRQTIEVVGKMPNDASQPGLECSLDLEYLTAVSPGVPTKWIFLDASDPNPFATWLTWSAAATDAELPLAHSLSVGVPENEFATLGPTAIPRQNAEMAALAARGVSVQFASGDGGYAPNMNYPASSPSVTAVGGVWNGDLGLSPLSVDPISAGGFSSLDANPIQGFQKPLVAHWRADTHGERPSHYNASHRCVPDLAAFDTSYEVFVNGGNSVAGGTSCAAPVVSGIVAQINNALLARGLKPLGLAAPFFYANADALLDITRGNNGGFAATPGFDPASGIGSFATHSVDTLISRAIALRTTAAP